MGGSPLVVLVGVRGAGKSTAQDAVADMGVVHVLRPTTTRPQREGESDEAYHFQKIKPASTSHAWVIKAGAHHYGMKTKELDDIPGSCVGLTVFHPAHLGELEAYRKASGRPVVTVGLDTIGDLSEQGARVAGDASRMMSQDEFGEERSVVRQCDIVLSGSEPVVSAALRVVCRLVSRPGVLDEEAWKALLRANALLEDADEERVQAASYDLRLADEYWIGGLSELTANNPVVTIPPYSYVIVKAVEVCNLPKFVCGRFDLRVSMFFRGLILSNGPQVDPGYEGALFCLLYNAGNTPRELKRGERFATLELMTTSVPTNGYKRKYQGRRGFTDFVPEDNMNLAGSMLDERLRSVEASKLGRNVGIFVSCAALLLAGAGLLITQIWRAETVRTQALEAVHAAEQATEAADAQARRAQDLQAKVDEALAALQALKEEDTAPADDHPATPPPAAPVQPKSGGPGQGAQEAGHVHE